MSEKQQDPYWEYRDGQWHITEHHPHFGEMWDMSGDTDPRENRARRIAHWLKKQHEEREQGS